MTNFERLWVDGCQNSDRVPTTQSKYAEDGARVGGGVGAGQRFSWLITL